MAKEFIHMRMEASQLFKSLVGFKYQLHEAISDLADNSVDAKCSKIFIEASTAEIIIADDGNGMTKDQLEAAITPWATTEKYRKGKLGVHGIGMKAASFSLGSKVEVHTRAKGGSFYSLTLNERELFQKTDTAFEVDTQESEEFRRFKLKHGTVIKITQVRKRKITQPSIDSLKHQIGLMFFRLIEKKELSIMVNDDRVEPLSPLLPGLKKGAPGNFYHDYGVKELKFKKDNGEVAIIRLRAAHIGRANFWSNNDRNKYRFFIRKKVSEDNEMSSGLLKLDDQGIYVMRNDRLIKLGGDYLGIVRSTSLLHHDVCLRIILEYDSIDDDVIGVDHTKTKPDLDENLKSALRDLWLSFLTSDSDKRFREENVSIDEEKQKRADRELKSRPLASPKWAKKAAEVYKIAEAVAKEKYQVEAKRETTVREEARQKQEWFEVVKELPFGNLWLGEKNKEGDVIVYLNERHEWYKALYLEKEPNQRRQHLNFLFYCIAMFEVDVDDYVDNLKPIEKEALKRAFKEFRKFVSRQAEKAS